MAEVTPARLRQWATEGHAAAQFALFKCYRDGDGVPRDLKQAGAYLRQAASNGHTRGMWILAYAYQFGRWGFPQNDALAIHWYEQLTAQWKREAERGESEAQATLKVLHEFAGGAGYE